MSATIAPLPHQTVSVIATQDRPRHPRDQHHHTPANPTTTSDFIDSPASQPPRTTQSALLDPHLPAQLLFAATLYNSKTSALSRLRADRLVARAPWTPPPSTTRLTDKKI